jgi:hypothetical protein
VMGSGQYFIQTRHADDRQSIFRLAPDNEILT